LAIFFRVFSDLRALEHYRSLVGVLGEALGTEPAPETRDLYEELRRGEQGAG